MAKGKGAKAPDLSSWSIHQLYETLASHAKTVAMVKAKVAEIQAEIDKRFMASVKAAYEQSGKEDGILRLPLQDGLEAECKIVKTVKWDSEELMKLAATMPWEKARSLFKIEFSMGETTYKGVKLADEKLAAEIDKARTVERSEPKITLVEKEGVS